MYDSGIAVTFSLKVFRENWAVLWHYVMKRDAIKMSKMSSNSKKVLSSQ